VPRAAAAAAVAEGQGPAAPYRSALGLASEVGPSSGESRGDGSDGDGSADGSGAAAPVLTLAATAVSVSSRGGSTDLRVCPGCSRAYGITGVIKSKSSVLHSRTSNAASPIDSPACGSGSAAPAPRLSGTAAVGSSLPNTKLVMAAAPPPST
jgi:hypothetical protein